MRFTIITRYYQPTPDGIAHHSSYIYDYLAQLGHSVQVIYDDGIISLIPKEVNLLVNKINRQKPDWIIFQFNGYSYNRFGAPYWLGNLFKKITSNPNIKLCLIIHETYIRKDKSIKLRIYRFLQKRALRISSKYAHLILTTTHLYQSRLSRLYRNSHLFFTPSNFEKYINDLPWINQKSDQIILGTFGNRNPQFLLSVLEQLEIKQLKCSFFFIGIYQPAYIRLIKEYSQKLKFIEISRTGKLTDRNIVNYLNQLDAFILLEQVREDGGGGLNTKSGSSATALCMGIPIFSTKGDFTNSQVYEDGKNYILLDHKDFKVSAHSIYEMLKNKDLLNQIGLNGQKLYRDQFSWNHYMSKMMELINNFNK